MERGSGIRDMLWETRQQMWVVSLTLIYFWLCPILITATGPPFRHAGSSVAAQRLPSSCGAQALDLWHAGLVFPQCVGS